MTNQCSTEQSWVVEAGLGVAARQMVLGVKWAVEGQKWSHTSSMGHCCCQPIDCRLSSSVRVGPAKGKLKADREIQE